MNNSIIKNYINHIENSISKALIEKSKLSVEILSIEGMSSSKVRHFLNNLLELDNVKYLEIGVWLGSTFISSMYKNKPIQAHAIDNFCENFGMSPCRELFHAFCKSFIDDKLYTFIDNDSFTVDLSNIKFPINIYFYDGNHSEESQEKALTYYDNILDDIFIFLVDDYNYKSTRIGTKNGIKKMGYKIEYEQVLESGACDPKSWWNGFYIAVLSKPK